MEAEALAHTNAMHEAKQLDNRMRDAYSQLRRSAYDTGSSSSPADDLGGIRIKPPHSPTSPTNHAHTRSRSREITLLENGMIVEHVDVRKEEKEARDRRRREEKRARKTSRSSVIDASASIISAQSNGAQAESGLKPCSRYSQASSTRPTSILTAPFDRPDLPGAYSQASFSDVHSLSSASPRRTRFFGIKHLSAGWRSQDSLTPSGVSGSMVDMQCAAILFYRFCPIFTFFIVSLSNVKLTALILLLLRLTSTLLDVVRSGRQQSLTTSATPKFPAKARQRRKKEDEDSPKSGAS